MRYIQPNIFLYFFLLILAISGFFFAVIWPQSLGFYSFIVLAALGGFGVACYIFYTKKIKGILVCPTGSNCNVVVTSRYSKFLGVPIEYLGMLYYFIVVSAYTLLIFEPRFISGTFLSFLLALTAFAFLFSLYLLFVQAFLLRQWCIWCLLSAMLSIVIFIVSLVSVGFAVVFLTEITGFLRALHGLGFVLGLGGAIAATFLFTKFLSDRDIDEKELKTLQMLSELLWLGLALTITSQIAFYIVYTDQLASFAPFLVQTIALFAATIASAALMIIFTPFLAMIPFGGVLREGDSSSLLSLRKPMFLTGAVSLSSWLFAFSMDYFPNYKFSFLFFGYFLFLAAALVIALIWERKFNKV